MTPEVLSDNPVLAVALAALTPGVEPRYALLVGLGLGLGLLESLALSAAGVLVLGLLLYTAIDTVDRLMEALCSRKRLGVNPGCIYLALRSSAARRAGGYVERYGWAGLIVFIAIPLPATGMYSGALAAALLGIRGPRLLASLLLGGYLSLAITAVVGGGVAVVST
ncbi:small multi-drug export protein [Aeropyrum pernix]|uniref:small multi-drug export protein n=1 Tax=Aeropyrum pernix TaxID=56636 RepID=UPI0011E509B0|nr:COG2426 family protein [Aeropyrum pernix]